MSTSYDITNTGPTRLTPGGPPTRHDAPRGTGTALDNYVRAILWISLIAFAISLGYLLWGLFSGAWCNPHYDNLGHAGKVKQLANIDLFFRILHISTIVALVSILFFTFRDESISYLLLTAGALFYLGIPYTFNYIFDKNNGIFPTPTSQDVVTRLQSMVWLFGVPGVVLMLVDFVRRFQDASENAAIQKANVRFGANVAEQAPSPSHRQIFLGRCWELSYCRDNVRPKCPIFLEKKGPCWWRKRGCMCDERIVLQAVVANDWKDQTKKTEEHYRARGEVSYALQAGNSPVLSEAAKRERCRGCVIYNEHQRQKYQAIVTVIMLSVPLALWLCSSFFEHEVEKMLKAIEAISQQLAFSDKGGISFVSGHPSQFIEWTIIVILTLVALTVILRLVEWWCFTKKL
jgi:hypothetical protein